MNICAEIEEKGGRWVATIPGVPGARGYGSTRIEAAIGVTVRALRILKDEPEKIWIADAKNLLETMLAEFGEVVHIPNAETKAERDPELVKIEDEVFRRYHQAFKILARH